MSRPIFDAGLGVLFGLLPLVCATTLDARAEAMPAPTELDRRVRTAHYDPGQVYRLQAQIGYQIELEFEVGETVLGQAAGDLDGIALAAFDNRVFLKPKAADVRTNLTIATNRRQYRFDYEVEDAAQDAVGMYVVRFVYPETPRVATPSPADQVEQSLEEASRKRPRNVDYWFCGNPAVRPIAASDDGVHTRIRFDVHAELPALFVRNDDGSESLLNFSMAEGDVIVHRVARRFIVRRGRLVGCIVNHGFQGSGERLESGTVAPAVERTRREAQP
ncbi:MAG: TrbG/VirB9 family P-type conjugative transfer protein [Steroidobacteraceae bacterium]